MNVTVIEGGNAINVIPDHAIVKADVRAYTPEEFDRGGSLCFRSDLGAVLYADGENWEFNHFGST